MVVVSLYAWYILDTVRFLTIDALEINDMYMKNTYACFALSVKDAMYHIAFIPASGLHSIYFLSRIMPTNTYILLEGASKTCGCFYCLRSYKNLIFSK